VHLAIIARLPAALVLFAKKVNLFFIRFAGFVKTLSFLLDKI
jgi:hypothetical protein